MSLVLRLLPQVALQRMLCACHSLLSLLVVLGLGDLLRRLPRASGEPICCCCCCVSAEGAERAGQGGYRKLCDVKGN